MRSVCDVRLLLCFYDFIERTIWQEMWIIWGVKFTSLEPRNGALILVKIFFSRVASCFAVEALTARSKLHQTFSRFAIVQCEEGLERDGSVFLYLVVESFLLIFLLLSLLPGSSSNLSTSLANIAFCSCWVSWGTVNLAFQLKQSTLKWR